MSDAGDPLRLAAALWAGDAPLGPWLRGDAADALRGLGIGRLQVNVDDDHVAPAQLRLTTFETGPTAYLFADVPRGREDEVLAVLREGAARVEAWEVEEIVPLAAPRGLDGERDPGLVNIALVRRAAGLDDETFRQRWLGDHTAVALRTQATTGYVQNRVVRGLEEATPELDAVVEETFPEAGMTDLHAFYGSAGDDAEMGRRMTELMTSVARFADDSRIDVTPTSRYVL